MLQRSIFSTLAVLLCAGTPSADASFLFTRFADLEANPFFSSELSWTDQYVIENHTLSITPADGNPVGAGSLLTAFTHDFSPINLGGETHLSLRARLDPGNENTALKVRFYSLDSESMEILVGGADFSTSAFTSGEFTTVTIPITFYSSVGSDSLYYWSISGDATFTNATRVTLDYLEAVPEPHTVGLLALTGLGAALLRRYRLKSA